MSVPCVCPSCGADWNAGDIPTKHLDAGYYGPDRICTGCGKAPHYSRRVGIYDDLRDMTVAWMCPDCRFTWDRGTDPAEALP